MRCSKPCTFPLSSAGHMYQLGLRMFITLFAWCCTFSRWCRFSSINPISLESYQYHQGGIDAVISPAIATIEIPPFNTQNRKHATRRSNRSTRDFRRSKRVSLASKCPGRWPRRKTNRPNQNALPVPCSQHHSLGLAISARCIRKAFQKDSMNKVGYIFFLRTEGGTSNSRKKLL